MIFGNFLLSTVDDGKFGTPQFIYSIGTALCRFPGNLADMSLQVGYNFCINLNNDSP